MAVRVQEADFDIGAEIAALSGARTDIGAIVTFTGLVRDHAGPAPISAPISAMILEHYPGMTERALAEIEREAQARWPLQASLIIHRHGALAPGDRIVLVAAASAHRRAAFEAAEFLMDFLKTRAPFWKKEETGERAKWVDAREGDAAAANRWRE